MYNKQRPRLQHFFNKIRTVLVTACRKPAIARPVLRVTVKHEQMELDLGLKHRE